MNHLTPAQIQFREFMRKLTGSPGTIYPAFHAYCWRIHGVLVTLWLRNSRVRVYQDVREVAPGLTFRDYLRAPWRQESEARAGI